MAEPGGRRSSTKVKPYQRRSITQCGNGGACIRTAHLLDHSACRDSAKAASRCACRAHSDKPAAHAQAKAASRCACRAHSDKSAAHAQAKAWSAAAPTPLWLNQESGGVPTKVKPYQRRSIAQCGNEVACIRTALLLDHSACRDSAKAASRCACRAHSDKSAAHAQAKAWSAAAATPLWLNRKGGGVPTKVKPYQRRSIAQCGNGVACIRTAHLLDHSACRDSAKAASRCACRAHSDKSAAHAQAKAWSAAAATPLWLTRESGWVLTRVKPY